MGRVITVTNLQNLGSDSYYYSLKVLFHSILDFNIPEGSYWKITQNAGTY